MWKIIKEFLIKIFKNNKTEIIEFFKIIINKIIELIKIKRNNKKKNKE